MNKVCVSKFFFQNVSQLALLKIQVDELLRRGSIRESMSPYVVSILFKSKKNCTRMMFVDSTTIIVEPLTKSPWKNVFLIHHLDDVLDMINCVVIFSKSNLKSGYYPVRIRDDDACKTTSEVDDGLYEYLVISLK